MKTVWQNDLRQFMIEQVANTHLFSLIIFFYALFCFRLPSNYYSYPRLGLVLTGSLAFLAAGVACINKNLARAKRKDFVEITYIVLLLVFCLAFVIVAGNTSSQLKVLLLLPVIIMSTARGKWWGMAMASLISCYLLIASLYAWRDTPDRVFEANLIFSGVMLLIAWLVGSFAGIERDVRLNLTDLNQELEREISERTRELALANQELKRKISERRRTEDLLKESEARFRSILDNTSVGVALLDQSATFLMINDAFCRFLGFPRQEILYKRLSQFVPLGANTLEKTLDDSLSGALQSRVLEQRFVHKDGEIVWGRLNASVIRDDQGVSRHKILVCEDVTSLKTRESELNAQSRIYEAMRSALQDILQPPGQQAEGAPALVGLAASLQSGDYEEVVASRVIEVVREITGATWVEFFSYDAGSRMLCLTGCVGMPPELLPQAKALLRFSLDEEQGLINVVARERRPQYVPDVSAAPGWVMESIIRSCYVVPLYYGETLFGAYSILSDQVNGFSLQQRAMADTLAFYISTAMENTRLFGEVQQAFERINSMQQQLLQSQKMEAVGQLAGGIAHDLNNQLTVIQASVDLNMKAVPENSNFGKAFKRIRLATEKSANLIRQLLLFGRKHPQFKVLLDLNMNVRELQEILERLVGEDVTVHLDLAPDLWAVYADATNIEQVIINLVINARDAMPGGGAITISTGNVLLDKAGGSRLRGPAGSFVCLSVSDTGAGIESQHLPHIFEPFFTTKEAGKGTGLGLSVAYGIIEAHGGWIDVESVPGEGSRFTIFLPAEIVTGQPDGTEFDRPLDVCQRGSGENILLVEDDPDVAALTMSLLTENGYTVRLCRSVAEAGSAFDQPGASFDLLLSDAILPDGKAINLVRQLRLKQPSLEMILFSGYADERAGLDQIQREGLHFLPKPYTAAGLLRQVREATERRRRQGAVTVQPEAENRRSKIIL